MTVLVLDDLQELSDMEEAEEIKARICRILTQGRLWVILISRGLDARMASGSADGDQYQGDL